MSAGFFSRQRPLDRTRSRTVAGAVTTFALTGLLVVAVVGVVEALALRRAGEDRAVDAARTVTQVVARGVVEPNLTQGVLDGDPAAIGRLDRVVHDRVLNNDLVRVKIWNADGTIVYSDEPRLIGATYPLGADEEQAIRNGTAEAELSDLSRPENRFERPYDKLLEVYLPITGPDGHPLLFEAYLRYSAIHRGRYQDIGSAYASITRWMQDHHRHPTGPPREIYLTDPASSQPDEALTEVQFPLR